MWSRRIAIIAAVIAGFGLVDSGYLTINHLQGSYIRCGDDCSAVLGSRYAEGVAGVPLAGFGAIAYIAVIVAAVFAAWGSTLGRQILAVMATTMALVIGTRAPRPARIVGGLFETRVASLLRLQLAPDPLAHGRVHGRRRRRQAPAARPAAQQQRDDAEADRERREREAPDEQVEARAARRQ